MAKLPHLIPGAEAYLDMGITLEHKQSLESDHYYEWGWSDQFGRVVELLGNGYFKSIANAQRKMYWELRRNAAVCKAASAHYREYQRYHGS